MKKIVKKLIKAVLIIITIATAIILFNMVTDRKPTFADSGFSTSYDSGGSSYSGSSYSSSYSGSDYSSRRKSDSRYNDYADNSTKDNAVGLIIAAGIVIIAYVVTSMSLKYKNRPDIVKMDYNNKDIEEEIKQYITNFNKEAFLQQGYKIYCDVQDAWMNFKLEDVRDILTDELYNMYESQLATLEVKGEQNIMKDFVLQRSFLKGVSNQNGTITITTGYIIEFYDYIIEQSTGKVVRGTDYRKMRVSYEMKFRQSLDESKKVTKCPNCGADIEMNTSGVCDYCHTKLVTENTKWVLTEKQSLDQEIL